MGKDSFYQSCMMSDKPESPPEGTRAESWLEKENLRSEK